MTKRTRVPIAWLAALWVTLLVGCATTDSISQLSVHQEEAFGALLTRLEDNIEPLELALDELAELDAEYTAMAFELERSLARAKRLDAMNAPWSKPTDELVETQRAVMLYNLYQVDLAEDKVLAARLAERRQALAEVLEAYEGLVDLVYEAVENVKTVSTHLNRPRSDQISELAGRFLEQVQSFHRTLESSQSPRLRALAEDVARLETEADAVKREADRAIANILHLRGNEPRNY